MNIKTVLLVMMAPLLLSCATMGMTDRLADYRHDLLVRADQGDAKSQYLLGMTYCCGFDNVRDNVTARVWLCRSALQGYVLAQYQLGRYYALYAEKWRQRNTTQDIILAHMWYSLAADQGNDMAALYKATLEREMTPRVIDVARHLKRHWRQEDCSDVSRIASNTR